MEENRIIILMGYNIMGYNSIHLRGCNASENHFLTCHKEKALVPEQTSIVNFPVPSYCFMTEPPTMVYDTLQYNTKKPFLLMVVVWVHYGDTGSVNPAYEIGENLQENSPISSWVLIRQR